MRGPRPANTWWGKSSSHRQVYVLSLDPVGLMLDLMTLAVLVGMMFLLEKDSCFLAFFIENVNPGRVIF